MDRGGMEPIIGDLIRMLAAAEALHDAGLLAAGVPEEGTK
jgi:hypothetical protein